MGLLQEKVARIEQELKELSTASASCSNLLQIDIKQRELARITDSLNYFKGTHAPR